MSFEWTIDQRFDNLTLRSFFAYHHLGKTLIHQLFQERRIKVNDKIILHDHLFHTGDFLWIDFQKEEDHQIDPTPIDIVYEDLDFLIVSKPQGLLVHDDGISKTSLTRRVNHYAKTMGYHHRVLPAHRIDKETTGLVLFAKHPLSLSYLSYLFEEQSLEKIYICEVRGHLKDDEGTIDLPIARDRHENKMRVDKEGKPAKTYYQVIEKKKETSLLKVRIFGGRTHQIRVHFSYKGYPVVGDDRYGRPEPDPLKLHFESVKFIHPRTGQMLEVSTKPPFMNP
ncbi:MAG: RluA family pseudouridine synthase [Acholeplasma sp.]|jgi:23S rRNA pseudouridine1911/1915/1917 synthase|nr:MAG: RluA family pseudouridine synthase [Acholeplasma sp.]